MRGDDGWHDVRIRNISSRGLGAMSATPPAIGQYAELRRGSVVIVARVVWQHGSAFGMRSRDKIDITALLDRGDAAKQGACEPATAERRRHPRGDSLTNTAERSKRASSTLQYVVLAAAGLAAALFASSAIHQVFSVPLRDVAHALAGAPSGLR